MSFNFQFLRFPENQYIDKYTEQFNHPAKIHFCLHPAAERILTSNELKIILCLHLIKDHQVIQG